MNMDDEKSYILRQLDAAIRVSDQQAAAICVTSAIGREGVLVRGGPMLPLGCEVELTLYGDRRETLSVRCVVQGLSGRDLELRYHGLGFEQRAHLEELIRPQWDGVDLFDGLMTMACLYGATSLKDWLCMTSLLERLQPHLVNRQSSLA